MTAHTSFAGGRVLAFESRRADEIRTLIAAYGGEPVVAPALREVPLESNPAAVTFARTLVADGFDLVIALTGVGVRTLVDVVDRAGLREPFLAALGRVRIVARGPKPLAVLRGLQVPVWLTVPEPNTWREVLATLDDHPGDVLRDARVAVQEYGVPHEELGHGLRRRGAKVTAVPVYRWALPEDTGPLERAVHALAEGGVDVVLFTTGVQVAHLWQIAARLDRLEAVRRGLARTLVASIGPTTSEALAEHGVTPTLEASPPKMGQLVRAAAERYVRPGDQR